MVTYRNKFPALGIEPGQVAGPLHQTTNDSPSTLVTVLLLGIFISLIL